MPHTVARRAAAKVNLALHVVGRRADSYHLLDSVAVFADFGDSLEIEPAEELSLSVSGPFAAHAPGERSDLVWRAAEAFAAHAGVSSAASIRVCKEIPSGAGLGGGSADAAAVLAALNARLDKPVDAKALRSLGLTLGADVPMCLVGQALRARGVGEEIDVFNDWPPLPMVLVWPGGSVFTAEVFATLGSRDNPPLPDPPAAPSVGAVSDWVAACRNDLEAPALKVAPEIGDVLSALRGTPGCSVARMSGSGSASFGLYAEHAQAEAAAARLSAAHPRWWVRATLAR